MGKVTSITNIKPEKEKSTKRTENKKIKTNEAPETKNNKIVNKIKHSELSTESKIKTVKHLATEGDKSKAEMDKSVNDLFEYVAERGSKNQKMGKCKICSKVARTDSLKKHIRTTHKKRNKSSIVDDWITLNLKTLSILLFKLKA